MDEYKTKVIFRKFDDNQVIALFPEEPGDSRPYSFMSYMHIGQHGSASHEIVQGTKLATQEEYRDLKQELESIGYDLSVYQKITSRMDSVRYFTLLQMGEEIFVNDG